MRSDEELVFLEYGEVTVCLKSGRAYAVVAELGYLGETPQGVVPGMSWRSLVQRVPRIQFDEEQHVWFVPEVDGMTIDIGRPAPPNSPSKWEDEAISVLDAENARVVSVAVQAFTPPPTSSL
jgi:hypothetical protein